MQPLLRQCPHLCGIIGCGIWSPMRLPAFAPVAHADLHPLTAHIPFARRQDREDAGGGASCRRREIEGLRQRDESHISSREFVQHRQRVDERASPVVKFPDHHHIELALLGGLEQGLTLGTLVGGARGHPLNGVRHRPLTPGGALAQGVYWHREGGLIVGRHTGREGSAHR
jgi:hypothetical protein